MMKSLLLAAAVLLSIFTFAQSKTESDIVNLSKKRVQWLLENKVDSLITIYDENSITVHGNGMIKSTVEHFNDVRNGRPVYRNIEIKESTVKDFGHTAILVGKGIFSISMNGQESSHTMVYTEVYIRKGNQWKLVARQASQAQ